MAVLILKYETIKLIKETRNFFLNDALVEFTENLEIEN